MKVIVLLVSQVLYALVSTFNISCPHRGHWKYRANDQCPEDAEKFVCLFDVINKHYAENCNGPLKEQTGDKTVINIYGRFDTEECAVERYQPILFSTTEGSECLYEKSSCNEEGQIKADNGSRKEDRLCTCDYRKGYAFVSVNRTSPCSCIPATEDCTCYLKPCGNGETLSPEFKCVQANSLHDNYTCQILESVPNRDGLKPGDPLLSIPEKKESKKYFAKSAGNGVVALLLIIVLVAVLILLWLFRKQIEIKLFSKKVEITKHLEKNILCNGGGSLVLTCEVNKTNTSATWKFNGEAIIASEKYTMTSDGYSHSLEIKDIQEDDGGEYTVHIENKHSSALLTVESTIITKQLEKNISCNEDKNVILTCEVNKRNTSATWKFNGEAIIASEKYTMTSEGYSHSLEIKDVQENDRGIYIVQIKNKSSSAILTVESTSIEEVTKDEINYFRMLYFLQEVAEEVVRKIFDQEFNHNQLRRTLGQHSQLLNRLKKNKIINKAEYDLLFPVAPPTAEYMMEITLNNCKYTAELEVKESERFIELAGKITKALTDLLSDIDGKHRIEVVQFRPGSAMVSLKLTYEGVSGKEILKEKLQNAVESGSIPPFTVDPSAFSFTQLRFEKSKPIPVKSKDFDIRLMIILMKNLANIDIYDKLPAEYEVTKEADLSRIKYYRNKVVQNSEQTLDDEDFDKDWLQLSQAVIRLGGDDYKKKCYDSKNFNPSPKQYQDCITTGKLRQVSSVDSVDTMKDFLLEEHMKRNANAAVRTHFDKQFPPSQLKDEIDKQKKYLQGLRNSKEMTPSEWDNLFPESGLPSSTTLNIKVMILLLKDTEFRTTDMFKAIQNLYNHLYKQDFDYRAVKRAIKEVGGEDIAPI